MAHRRCTAPSAELVSGLAVSLPTCELPGTGPVILTLCVSILALVVSAIALGWQVVSWRRSGPRVRVTSKSGFATSEPFVSIEITNAGRLATEIRQIAYQLSRLDDRKQVLMLRDVFGNLVTMPIPSRIPADIRLHEESRSPLRHLSGR